MLGLEYGELLISFIRVSMRPLTCPRDSQLIEIPLVFECRNAASVLWRI